MTPIAARRLPPRRPLATALPAVLAALTLAGLAAGCARAPLLADVTLEPAAITPNQDGDADVTRIAYAIGAPAHLTIELVGSDGTAHRLRDRRPRAPGAFVAEFGGVVDGRMLPDDTYTVRLTAAPRDGGAAATVTATLQIADADTRLPELAGFAVQPDAFTPNQDGLGDRVTVTYRLDEPADVRLTLEDADGNYVQDILEDIDYAEPPGEPGVKQYDFDAGVDADAPPPPDGEYRIVGQARDRAGNVVRQTLPLTIRDGGQPRAAIVGDVDWSARILPLGATLVFTATVENVGDTPIRTRGPEPGFVYDNTQTFNLQLPPGVRVLARTGGRPGDPGYRAASRRVVFDDPPGEGAMPDVDLDLARPVPADDPLAAGAPLAGRPLAEVTPGAVPAARRVRLCGTVRDGAAPVAGAEVFAFEIDGDRGRQAVADAQGRYCFDDLAVPPPFERSFARSSGAVRIGLEYDDDATDLAYPYRWQLGRTVDLDVCESGGQRYLCLPPGAELTVTGAVRFAEPPLGRETSAHLSLMHEDVRRMHGPYGIVRLTVEY